MANKEKIDYLLLDIRELETLIAGMRDAEIYPVSFFSQTFDLTHKILKDLHSLEKGQIEILRRQMEEHQALLQAIPQQVAAPIPETSLPQKEVSPVTVAIEPEITHKEEVIPETPEPEIREEITEQPAQQETAEKEVASSHQNQVREQTNERSGIFLSDLLEKKNLSDFRKEFSLNDRFRFRRELFGGNEDRMNKAITDLNNIHTYEDSVTYLNDELKWNLEDEAVADFIKLLEKRFL